MSHSIESIRLNILELQRSVRATDEMIDSLKKEKNILALEIEDEIKKKSELERSFSSCAATVTRLEKEISFNETKIAEFQLNLKRSSELEELNNNIASLHKNERDLVEACNFFSENNMKIRIFILRSFHKIVNSDYFSYFLYLLLFLFFITSFLFFYRSNGILSSLVLSLLSSFGFVFFGALISVFVSESIEKRESNLRKELEEKTPIIGYWTWEMLEKIDFPELLCEKQKRINALKQRLILLDGHEKLGNLDKILYDNFIAHKDYLDKALRQERERCACFNKYELDIRASNIAAKNNKFQKIEEQISASLNKKNNLLKEIKNFEQDILYLKGNINSDFEDQLDFDTRRKWSLLEVDLKAMEYEIMSQAKIDTYKLQQIRDMQGKAQKRKREDLEDLEHFVNQLQRLRLEM